MAHTIRVANYRDEQVGYYVGRRNNRYGLDASALANPFRLDPERDTPNERKRVLQQYREWLAKQINEGNKDVLWELQYLAKQHTRRDITLLCWCAPSLCHASVIAEMVREMAAAQVTTAQDEEAATTEQEALFR